MTNTELLVKKDELLTRAVAEGRSLNESERAELAKLQDQLTEARAVPQVGHLGLSSPPVERDTPEEVSTVQHGGSVFLRDARQLGLRQNDTGGFKSASDCLRTILGPRYDPRLDALQTRGMTEGVGADGGFSIPDSFLTDVLGGIIERSTIMGRVRTFPVANGDLKIPAFDDFDHSGGSPYGGITATWTSEEGSITASSPTLRQITLQPRGLKALVGISNEALSNAVDLAAIVNDALAGTLGWKIDEAILRGSGSGQPLGVLECDALIEQAKESGQAADTVVFENVTKMWSRLLPGCHRNAVWLVNAEVLPQLYSMSLAVGTGGSAVYQPAGGASGTPYNSLLGRPVIVTEHASALGDVGDIILMDPTYYALAVRKTITVDRSQHVYFTTDRTALRAVAYLDGQPLINSTFTPFKGANTQSAFITLAARA